MAIDIEFENQVLSIGNEFLPAVARKVRDGEELTDAEGAEYSDWLESQAFEAAYEDSESCDSDDSGASAPRIVEVVS